MSETPITDKVKWCEDIGDERCEYVPAEEMEKMERELATITAERDALKEWKATTERVLADGHAVHLNMLRGTIAAPTKAQMLHLLGDHAPRTP